MNTDSLKSLSPSFQTHLVFLFNRTWL